MTQSGVLTLLSDFGLSDTYVGVMKGTIAQVNPALTVIDLTHQIPPQNIAAARFALMTAHPYFPVGVVHVAIVDPGVGSDRRAIAVAIGSNSARPTSFLVGPDNGLFSGVFNQHPIAAAVELTNPRYWRTPNPSSTFHGRDIFAPVGAHLASGTPLAALGDSLEPDSLVRLAIPNYLQIENLGDRISRITGCIQAIDHFGNLITNVPDTMLSGKNWSVVLGNLTLIGRQVYSDTLPGEPLALVGSHGWVEVAVNSGSAQTILGLDWGSPIQVVIVKG
ncbi:SAM-dependent chlorinase/fluorinase [Leptolyngbya sp. FACHB-36]|uniref:SAM hydrolase/SAM-dependent halogenase family protein n=1 Tax=Leptolyngbya sp. FACHB-36 TaxID=2692808 RepID=UPI001681015F|nr:SAM-dependent chlorinase/fluorinase [Leptolyngbya sp. FACHB-36]MBD2021195.1 SAM-dependent chlorinase/fluorinase [Leptolyngbya sp. FACHB-36]